MNRIFLRFVFVVVSVLLLGNDGYAQNYFKQSFDGTTYPPTGWTSSSSGSYSWQRVTVSTSGGYVPPYFRPHSGAAMVWYNSYYSSTGSYALLTTPAIDFTTYTGGSDDVSFWFYRDYSYAAYDSVIVYANTSSSLSGATKLGAVCRYYLYTPAVPISGLGWNQYSFAIPSSFRTSSSVYLIFKAYSAYGDCMGMDDISVDHYAGSGSCSGTISASINRVGTVCYNQPVTLFEQNTAYATGVKYQWQSSTSPSGPWVDIAGATNNAYTATVLSGTGYYRVIDTCVSSGTYATSNVDTINATACYCSTPQTYYSGAQTTGDQYNPYSLYGYYCSNYGYTYNGCTNYKITLFSVWGSSGSYIRETTLSCPTNCTSDGAKGAFDRTGVYHDTVTLVQGQTYNDTVNTSYGYYTNIGIWVDWNDNGAYEQSENVWFGGRGSSSSLTTYPGTINVPLLAPTGYHKMRVRYCYSSSISSDPTSINDVEPCSWITPSGRIYYYGAAQDYMVKVEAATPCTGTPTMSIPSTISACRGDNFTMNGTVSLTGSQGFQWQTSSSASGPWTSIPGATNTSYSTIPANIGVTYYRCLDTCRSTGNSIISNTCTVTTSLCYCAPSYYYSPGTSPYSYYCASYGASSYSACHGSYNISRVAIYGYAGSNLLDGALSCPSSCNNGYFDRTSLSVNLQQGGSYADSVYLNYGYYSNIAIWIDFNDDGVFNNATEQVLITGTYSTYKPSYANTINIPLSANTGTHRMRVRYAYNTTSPAASSPNDADPCNYISSGSPTRYFYYGVVRDYTVNIIPAPPCSGTPSVSVTPAGPLNLCTGTDQTLTGNYTILSGQHFQWMRSTDGGATWADIPGATDVTYTFNMGTSSTLYMLRDSCANSGLTAYSNTVNVGVRTVCPCTPTNYYTAGCSYPYYYISNFTLTGATSTLNQSYSTANCNGTSNYQDLTNSATVVTLFQGTSYSGTATEGYSTYYETVQIWIDFNDNGTFESSEAMLSVPLHWYGSSATRSYSISIPACANTGLHLMRMRNVYVGTSYISAIDPCANNGYGYTYYYGNSFDFMVNIASTKTTPTISPSSNLNYCSGNNFTLIASSTSTSPTPVFQWVKPDGTTSSGSSISVSSATYANSGIYTVRDVSGGCPSGAAYDTINVWTTPTFATGYPKSTSPVCTPDPLKLFAGVSPPNAAITWTGPSSYSSSVMNPVVANPTSAANASSLTGTYSITADNHGCTATKTTSVNVFVTPNITGISKVDPTTCTCNCGSITLTGLNNSTTYTLNYVKNGVTVGPVSITSNSSGNVTISGLGAGIYDDITLTLNGCPSAPQSITVNNPSVPPSPSVSTNAPVCYGTTLSFTGTVSASGLTWTWNGPGGWTYTNSGTSSNPVKTTSATFADSGNYYVYVTDALGCNSLIQTLNADVKPLPNTPFAPNTNAALPGGICAGTTLTISNSTTTPPGSPSTLSYSFTDPTGGTWTTTTVSSTLSVPTVAANLAGTWSVYAVLNGCKSAVPATVYTYIKPIPGQPNPSSNSPICAGVAYNPNLLNLMATDTTPGVTYTWTGPSSALPASTTSGTYTITNPPTSATGTYTVVASKNGCSSPSSTVSVTVNPSPSAPTVSPKLTVYCQYDATTVPLSASGTSIRWYTASTGGTALSGAPTPSTAIAGMFLYYATQTNSYGCESPATTDSVLVKTKPGIPYATPVYTYCQADNASILTAIGANLLWYTSATGGTGSPIPPTPSTTTAGTFMYYVTQTVNGCESDRFAITVNVKAKPPKPNVGVKEYCQNEFALPLSAPGSNLLWYRTPTGGPASSIAPTPITSYADSLYYYVTQTVNGCESDRAELLVVVNYTPNALIVANEPYVCQYDSIFFTYYGNALKTASYNWTMPTGATLLQNGGGQGPILVRFDSAGKQTVSLQVTNKKCKSPVTSYVVDVRQAPYAATNIKTEVCQEQILDVSLGYANQHIDKYDWNFDGAEVVYGSEGGGPFGIRWQTPGVHVVQFVAYTNTCPSLTQYDTVTVHPLANAHVSEVSSSEICSGDSVQFIAERYNPAYLYTWTPAVYFGTQTNRGTVYGFIQHTGYIQLQVTTQYGCTSTDSTLIVAQPCCEVFFPNAFTPNGDGKNDVFRPVSKGNQVIKTFRITNRWGQVMFETVNQRTGWNGTFNGKPQDLGTYYYFIKYVCANGKVYEEKGEVLLIK